MRQLTIWVEHSAGWGNVGDDALLVSAVRRLEAHLGPIDLVLSGRGDCSLPASLPPHERIRSPQCELDRVAARLRQRLQPVLARRGVAQFGMDERSRLVDGRVYELAAATLLARLHATRRLPVPFPTPELAQAVRTLARCDVLYVVGDNAFNDFYPAGVVGRRWLCRLARISGAKVALSSQGFGPLDTPWARRQLVRLLRDVDLLSLRDHAYGRARVREANPHFSARVTADEAFALAAGDGGEAQRLLGRAGIGPGEPFVAVNFRITDCIRDTTDLAPRLAGLCDRLVDRTGATLAFFPMSYSAHWGVDLDYAERIRSHMKRAASLRSVPLADDVGTIKAAISRARYTFGTSYHMHVFGLSQGRPALVLYTGPYYRAKSEGLAGFYPGAAAAHDIEQTSDARLIAEAAEIEADYLTRARSAETVNVRLRMDNDWMLRQLALSTGRAPRAGDRRGRRRVVAPRAFARGALIGTLTGTEVSEPSVYSIQVAAARHLELRDAPQSELAFRYLNHACDPNALVDVDQRAVLALAPIAAGEEVTFDYLTTESRLVRPFTCRCGAARCRGWIAGFDAAEPDARAELRDRAAPHLVGRDQRAALAP